jgi:uncharacterized membrane protein
MSLLLLIVFSVLLALVWRELCRLRERIEMLETAGYAPMVPSWPESNADTRLSLDDDGPDQTMSRPSEPIAVTMPTVDQLPPPDIAEVWESIAEATDAPPSARFEDVFGRRLPIWAGGLALAVAGVLIVRYSIEAGLVSPWVRVVLGLFFGAGLIGGAELALRRDAAVRDPRVRQSLAGAGIATFYAVTLASVHLYDLIGPGTAFVAMALVTILAAVLALRFGAPSALLGLAGGLAAPALVGADAPNVPLLTLYLALTVGGLCALGRQQRWWWLGTLALAGGFGWGAMLIFGGALDLAAALSVGLYTLALAIALPSLLTGDRAAVLRVGASMVGCAQLAALVALGGFAPLDWGLFGLISIAILWLSRREALFADLPAPALGVAILLGFAWPAPTAGEMGIFLAALVAIHAVPAALRLWRDDARPFDAPMVAAVTAAIGVLPALRFDQTGAVTLIGAALAAGVATRGWRVPGRADDARFAILTITAAGLTALAAAQLLPFAAWASAAALLCAAMLTLADLAEDRRITRAGWTFGAVTMALLCAATGIGRLFGAAESGQIAAWIVPALAALGLAVRSTGLRATLMQPATVIIGYGAAAQLMPGSLLPMIPVAALAALVVVRRATMLPAALTISVIALGWAIVPLLVWAAVTLVAASGAVVTVDAWPDLRTAVLRLALPGGALLMAFRLMPSAVAIRSTTMIGVGMLVVAAHVALTHAIGIDGQAAFVARSMMERALWEGMLAIAAIGAWRFGRRHTAIALGAAALGHVIWFTGIVLNPLVAPQDAGIWLMISYAVAGGLLWATPRLLPDAVRQRDGALMLLIVVAAFTLLRQLSHAPMPLGTGTDAGEQIARSILALMLAGGFLCVGIVRRARDWRLASLALMLVAVAKVFLFDAAGLDGLARIASFAALGFSLIGIGWLYSRYLPDAAR